MDQEFARGIPGASAADWGGPVDAVIKLLSICIVLCAVSSCALAFNRPTVWFEVDRTFVHESLAESALGGLLAFLLLGTAIVLRGVGRPIVAGIPLALCGVTFLAVRIYAIRRMSDIATSSPGRPPGQVLDFGGLSAISDIGLIGLMLTAIVFALTLGTGFASFSRIQARGR